MDVTCTSFSEGSTVVSGAFISGPVTSTHYTALPG
jgi:hypothetical protein